jgi:predicted nuclease of restriction endonuclease-like (RecB) superfamily
LPEHYSERNFRKAIIENLKDFLLEIGKDFTYIEEEYRVQVGGHDYFIDLLFYHRVLSCLVAFELKISEFKPEYIGYGKRDVMKSVSKFNMFINGLSPILFT